MFALHRAADGELAWLDSPMRSEFGPLMVGAALEQFGAEMPAAFTVAVIFSVSLAPEARPPTVHTPVPFT